jgi:2'-5' RNA ligase
MSEKPGAGDYRIFVGAFPEGDLAERIQAVRHKYDPVTARVTPPHVTLWGTMWHSGPATVENEAETIHRLEILPGVLPPFALHLSGIKNFSGEKPVVYLGVTVDQGLVEARNLLQSVLGLDKHRDFSPHLTLAMRLSWENAWAMIKELESSPWNKEQFDAPISELCLMQRGPTDRAWRCIYHLKLL